MILHITQINIEEKKEDTNWLKMDPSSNVIYHEGQVLGDALGKRVNRKFNECFLNYSHAVSGWGQLHL